jgi:hypothetical protein
MGLLTFFYHNSADVNKKFRRVPGSDFSDLEGSDYSFNCSVDEGNCRFKYSQI